jgi:hypothetical protein
MKISEFVFRTEENLKFMSEIVNDAKFGNGGLNATLRDKTNAIIRAYSIVSDRIIDSDSKETLNLAVKNAKARMDELIEVFRDVRHELEMTIIHLYMERIDKLIESFEPIWGSDSKLVIKLQTLEG